MRNSRSGLSIIEAVVFAALLGIFVLVASKAVSQLLVLAREMEFRGVLEDLRTNVRETLSCDKTFTSIAVDACKEKKFSDRVFVDLKSVSDSDSSKTGLFDSYKDENLKIQALCSDIKDAWQLDIQVGKIVSGKVPSMESLFETPVVCSRCASQAFTAEWNASSGVLPNKIPGWKLAINDGKSPSFSGGNLVIDNGKTKNRTWYTSSNLDFPCGVRIAEVRLRVVSSSTKESDRAPSAIKVSTTDVSGVVLWFGKGDVFLTNYSGGNQRYLTSKAVDTGVWHTYRIESTEAGNVTVFVDGAILFTGKVANHKSNFKPYKIAFGDASAEAKGEIHYQFVRHNYSLP